MYGIITQIHKYCEEHKIPLFDLRIDQCDIGDIDGIPYKDENGDIQYITPQWWHHKGILIVDNLARTKTYPNQFYKKALKRLQSLPKETVIIYTGETI